MFLVPQTFGWNPPLTLVEGLSLASREEEVHGIAMPPVGIESARLTQFDHVASEFHPSLDPHSARVSELLAASYPDDAVVMAGYTRLWMNLLFDTSIIGEEWCHRGDPEPELFFEQTDYLYQRTKARIARSARDAILGQTALVTRVAPVADRIPRMAVLRAIHKYVVFGCSLEDYDVTEELGIDNTFLKEIIPSQFNQSFSFYSKGATELALRTKPDTEEREMREALERMVYFSQRNVAPNGQQYFSRLLSEKDMDWLFMHRLGIARSKHFLYVNLANLRTGFPAMEKKGSKRLREAFFRKWYRYLHDVPIYGSLISEDGSVVPLDRIPPDRWGPVHVVFIPVYVGGDPKLWFSPGETPTLVGHWILCVYYTRSKKLYFFDPLLPDEEKRRARFVTAILAESGLFSLHALRSTEQMGHWPATNYVLDMSSLDDAADDQMPMIEARYAESIRFGGWPLEEGVSLPTIDFAGTDLIGKTYLQKEDWECGYMSYLIGVQIVRTFYSDARTGGGYPEEITESTFIENMTGMSEADANEVANPTFGVRSQRPFYEISERMILQHHDDATRWILARMSGVAEGGPNAGPWTAERLHWTYVADAKGDSVLDPESLGMPPFIRVERYKDHKNRLRSRYMYYLSVRSDEEGQPILAPRTVEMEGGVVVVEKKDEDVRIAPATVATRFE